MPSVTVKGHVYQIGDFTPQTGSSIYFKLMGAMAATAGDITQLARHVSTEDFLYIQNECLAVVMREKEGIPGALTPIYSRQTNKFAFADLANDGPTIFRLTIEVLKERIAPFFRDEELTSQMFPQA